MANLSQTAANVALGGSGVQVKVVQVGEGVTQGQPGYLSTDGKYYQADANLSATTARAVCIFLTPASTDGYAVIVDGGGRTINLGATLTVGETYVVSATKGAICPIADLTTGDYPCIIGTAISTSAIITSFYFSGVAK